MSERARRYLETHPQPDAQAASAAALPPYRRQIGHDGLYRHAPARGPFEAVAVCLLKFLDFGGRASRSEYWFFVLFQMLAGLAAALVDVRYFGVDMSEDRTGPVGSAVGLVLFLPLMAVSWRRLHDIGRSGWWIGGFWLVLVGALLLVFSSAASGQSLGTALQVMIGLGVGSLVYGLIMLVFLCTRGDPGPNRYG